ncbi:MAG: ATP-dependent Clp protease adapter ClpS [Gammaproteobacteria bacterium]|nr:ATP-dependent Clp protease adapter ClpS [Gammaproteobacteria bacterium]
MSGYFLDVMNEHEQQIATAKPQLMLPKKYCVLLHNDDYTPMAFVVTVLERFFFQSESQATALMLQVHQSGQAQCGIFTRDIAETKVVLVNDFARQHDYPLLCSMEQIEA